MSSEPAVLLDLADGVAEITLNRPDASNAMNEALLSSFEEVVAGLRGEPDLGAVLLRGTGKNFCGGGDVVEFEAQGEELPAYLRALTARLQNVVRGLVELPAPVVALAHGAVTGGGGFGLICSSDIVLATADSRFMLGATRVGMTADGGVSVSLTRIVGLRQALRLALENPMIDAEEALSIGLLTRVVADEEALLREGRESVTALAAGARPAQGETKRLLWEGLGRSFAESLADEARTVAALSGTAEARAGLRAVIERRRPDFTNI